MKIAITADTHINNTTYGVKDPHSQLYLKTIDSLKAFEFFVDKSIEEKVDRIVVSGDVYSSEHPTNTIRKLFNEQIQRLVGAKIQVVLMTGNHDVCREHHALQPLDGWTKRVKVVDSAIVERAEDFTAIYIPHDREVHCKEATFSELIYRHKVDTTEVKGPILFFGHFGVNGAMGNDKHQHIDKRSVSVGDIQASGADIAFLGHFHKYQKLDANIPIYYVGSLEKHRMDEVNGDRGFFIYDTETRKLDRINYEGGRPMSHLSACTFQEAYEDIEAEESWEGHILGINCEGDEKDYTEIRARAAEIRSLFKSRGGAHLLFYNRTIKREEGDAEDETSVQAVEKLDLMKYLDNKIEKDHPDDDVEVDKIKTLLEEIMSEARQKIGEVK